MGSYSETCGFSGLEIGEQDSAYVMLLRGPTYENSHGPYDLFAPQSTLLKGEYNDYGYLRVDDDPQVLAVFNQQTGLTLEQHDDFSLDQLEAITSNKLGENLSRFWIHASVFDRLGEIQPEFPYVYLDNESVKVRDINQALDMSGANERAQYKKLAERIAAIEARSADSDAKADAIEMALLLMSVRRSDGGDRLGAAYGGHIQKAIQAGEDYEAFLVAKRRNSLLAYAAGELRKKIVPSEGIGPQHGGHIASVQFAKMVLEVQADRAKERDDEDEQLED